MTTIQSVAQQFNVDPGALACLQAFLVDNIGRNRVAFEQATPEERSKIIMDGVEAWHRHSQALLGELIENKTEAAQQMRKQIAADVYARAKSLNA